MDPTDSDTRLPHSSSISTTSADTFNISKVSNFQFNFNIASYRPGNHHSFAETSHRARPLVHTRLPIHSVRHPQKGWRPPTGAQPETAESTLTRSALQDGNHENNHPTAPTGRLFNIHRLKRRFPPHRHSSCITSPTAVPMAQSTVSVPGASIWPQPLSSGVHQGSQTRSQVGLPPGDQNLKLLGRLVDNGKDLPSNQNSNTEGMSKNARARLAPQFEKVLSNTFSADISPRLHHRHVQNDDFHSREENSQSPSHGLLLIETEDDFMDDSGSVYWDCSGDAVGQPTGSVSDTTPSCSTKSNTVPTDYSSTTADATRIDLVDQSTQQMEWSTSSESSTNNANIHGCIRQRLRDCVERPALSRQMDSHRAIISHQLQRAFSRSENISSHSGATQQSPAACRESVSSSESVV
ncbi:hypothetical protein G6F35_004739 [Rhizopus arrhizus]|nr:hypothetical protein G6F35_004739 [Rhizopus arrhizus]KAG1412371.1 hypothetical protein G6F58_008047 [Rhizopus delemar]